MALRTSQLARPTGNPRWAAACAVVAVIATLGGCGSSTPSVRAADTSFGADSWVDALTGADDAGQAQLNPVRISTMRRGVPHTVFGVSSSGRLLASRVTGRGAETLGTPHLGWLDRSTFTALDYDAAPSRDHQVAAADHDGDDVAWVETTSTDPGLFDWTVWASDGKSRHEVDSSARLGPADRQKRVFGMTEPIVADGRTFWAADVPGDGASVLGASTTGPKPGVSTIAAAGLPAVSSDALHLVRSPAVGSDDDTTRIIARDLASGKERVLAHADLGSRVVTRLVASDHHLAWVVSDAAAGTSQLFVRDLGSGVTRGIRMNHPGLQTMSLGISDRLVVWGNGSAEGDGGEYVLDLEDGSVWRLGDQPGFSVAFVDGSTVAWADLPDDSPTSSVDYQVAQWKNG